MCPSASCVTAASLDAGASMSRALAALGLLAVLTVPPRGVCGAMPQGEERCHSTIVLAALRRPPRALSEDSAKRKRIADASGSRLDGNVGGGNGIFIARNGRPGTSDDPGPPVAARDRLATDARLERAWRQQRREARGEARPCQTRPGAGWCNPHML